MDREERRVAGLTVTIDRTVCVGFETCVETAPDLFRMDEEGVATFAGAADAVPRERAIEACRSCPVDALEATDASGRRLAP